MIDGTPQRSRSAATVLYARAMTTTKISRYAALGILLAAAILEVAGDALIRKGLRGGAVVLMIGGFAVLGSYGIIVNLVPVDFSRLLGAYVGVFAVVSVLGGAAVFAERIAPATWGGLALILIGSLVIHFGAQPE